MLRDGAVDHERADVTAVTDTPKRRARSIAVVATPQPTSSTWLAGGNVT